MPDIRLVKRSLTKEEARDFSREMRLTPNIIGYRPSELSSFKNVLVAEASGKAMGILVYLEADKFIDLKILLVKESVRGIGYGGLLVKSALRSLDRTKKPAYAVTRNPLIIRLLEEAGFSKVSFLGLPLACQVHQLKMIFSLYRIKEAARKSLAFPHQPKFSYYLRSR